ncbi:hypothetical protein FIU88_19105 (plasmid) [Halomonas sp. THAF12]|uniref:hypothetical protein n=1 Tax=Halomonas sp. THAF12 TaxID=2587849 RepID=UPI001267FC86|nr:hypothetical protein [Halomonas sp. THAF12]QFT86821.1 hypothetical protein FIU88_17890 [Halomonas sp. THAF12]QFT87064.1 hypothetical protein FIU88_19105 [Halomonas sp. THAF12]
MATSIGSVKGSSQELRSRFGEDARQRRAAANILDPSEVRGDYDAGRMMETTLGGEARPITNEDLAAFRQNARTAGRRFKGGITVRQVVDLSLSKDRKRARTEIPSAVPASSRQVKGGALETRFMTSSSPQSKHARHQVIVEFVDFEGLVANGSLSPRKAARELARGSIRFDCTCEHHRYRRRYIATIGRYNAGRPETGYPKITNPDLSGVACKHVLRVMSEIEGGSAVQMFLARAIEKARGGGTAVQRTSQKSADRQAQKQDSRPMAANAQETGDRDFDRSRRALRKAAKAASATTTQPKRTAKGSRAAAALGGNAGARDKLLAAARDLGISPDQAAKLLAAAAKDQS